MKRTSLICLLLAAAAIIAAEAPNSVPTQPETPAPTAPAPAADQAPPAEPPQPAETPVQPVPAPAAAPAPGPPPAPLPAPAQPEFVSPRQGVYGPLIPVPPAQRIAMLETGGPVPATDPVAIQAAGLLAGLTARYVEDAPRIAELTIRTCKAVRAADRPASPLEMLDAALRWKRPARPGGNVPRRFEGYAALYKKLRVEETRSHA